MSRNSTQTVINFAILILIIGALILGALVMIPSRNPLGPMIGRLLSSKYILSGLLGSLDTAALAEALRENPEMLSEIVVELGPEGAEIIATAVNDNPGATAQFVAELKPETLARLINDPGTAEFTVALTRYLDPSATARVVNENGDWLSELVGLLDARVLAGAVNENGEFLTAITAAIDPAVLAQALNDNGGFIAGLVSFLDPAVLATALNVNPSLIGDLMAYLDSAVAAGVINANGPFTTSLLYHLDPQVITAGMNAHPTFLSRLMSYLDPVVIAGVVNMNTATITVLLNNLSDELLAGVLAVTAHNPDWTDPLMTQLDPGAVAAALNNGYNFISGLINSLDPAWAAGIADAHPDLVFQFLEAVDPELAATMINNERLLANTLPLIDTIAVGMALGENADLVTRLIPLLDPALAEITNRALEGNPQLLSELIANLDGAGIAAALAQAPSFLTAVIEGTSGDVVVAAAGGGNENPELLINLLNNLDSSAVALALDLSGGFLPGLLAMLPPNVAEAAALAANTNPALAAALDTLDPAMVAGVLNSGAADDLMAGLTPLLSEGTAQAIAEGLNTDAGQILPLSFIKGLIIAIDPRVIADAVNNNPDFVAGLLGHLNADTAQAVAEGMNTNPTLAGDIARYLDDDTGQRMAEALSANTAIIEPLIANLSPEVGEAIAVGINVNSSGFSTKLVGDLSNEVAQELAAGLNANTQLVTTLLQELSGDTGTEMALGFNQNSGGGSPSFLEVLLGATSADTAQALSDAINNPPYNMDAFLSNLIRGLDANTAAAAAQGLNSNPALVENLLRNLDGQEVALQLNANEDWITALVGALDPSHLADALNGALADPGGQAFMVGFLNTLDGNILAGAVNANPSLIEEFLDRAAANGLGGTWAALLNQVMASVYVDPADNFLVELMGELDAQAAVDIVNGSLQVHSLDLPNPGHNMLECLWLKAEGLLFNMIYTRSWGRVTRYGESPLFPPAEVHHWDP